MKIVTGFVFGKKENYSDTGTKIIIVCDMIDVHLNSFYCILEKIIKSPKQDATIKI